MKQIVFSEEEFKSLNDIGDKLFNDEKDPRSSAYVRKLKRPEISLFKTLLLYIILPAAVIILIIFLLNYFNLSKIGIVITAVVILTAYILFSAKQICVSAIKLYQKYAPDSLRNKCRFEPSCSEYMILAIEKYGLINGVKKGICRLKRCNINGGGYDFP